MNEEEMRDAKVPTFQLPHEVMQYMEELVTQDHDYGTCVYAMSMSAVAAFNHVASRLGVTGFQASCADLDIIRRTRRIERFVIIDLENALYPQYDLHKRLDEALEDAKPWLAEKAREALKEEEKYPDSYMHPDVRRHMEELANEA